MSSLAIVVGGGIGGLAAGVALARVGVRAAVFERAPELREVGAGVTLWSNAVKALDRLGLREAVVRSGSILERALTLSAEGRLLSEMDLGAINRRAGAPSVCVHRADLQRALAQALDPGRLHLGATCVGFEQDAAGVAARFAGGREEGGSILVGADGIRSTVRERLWGQAAPRYAGYIACRGIARREPPELPTGAIVFGLGRGTQIGIQRCGGGRVYWFATLNAPAGTAAGPEHVKRRALEGFRGWFPLVQAVVEATDESALLWTDVIDRRPSWPWGEGRVTLLGDAVHPTTPNLGQGACQALESAVTLAHAVGREGVSARALRTYERRRRRRTAMVTRRSWSMGNVFQWESRPAVWLRRLAVRSGPAGWMRDRLFRELLGHEEPELVASHAPAERHRS